MSQDDDRVGPDPQHGAGEEAAASDDPQAHGVGSAAEEAVKLLGALGEWARSVRGDLDDHLAPGAPECTYCPICRTVHVLREAGPEVCAHLASAAGSLAQAAGALMSSFANSGASPRSATVQRIDLDGEDDSWEDDE